MPRRRKRAALGRVATVRAAAAYARTDQTAQHRANGRPVMAMTARRDVAARDAPQNAAEHCPADLVGRSRVTTASRIALRCSRHGRCGNETNEKSSFETHDGPPTELFRFNLRISNLNAG